MYLEQVDNNITVIQEKERAGQLEKIFLGPSWLCVAVIKHHDKKQLREDGIYFVSSRASSRDTKAGTQRPQEFCLLACSLWLAQFVFVYTPEPPGPSHINH